jgi:TetR/AcrR family transcriptional regulator
VSKANVQTPTPIVIGDATERILAAAEKLFAESGFDAVTMNAVAELAGVSKANIFHHFNSKDALYLAAMRRACRRPSPLMDNLESANGTFRERLLHFAKSHLAHVLENEQTSRLILREVIENDPQRCQELAEQVFGDNFARLVSIMRSGQERGELRADVDAGMVATLLIGADIFFFLSREVSRHLPDVKHLSADPAAYSNLLVNILMHGITPNNPEP